MFCVFIGDADPAGLEVIKDVLLTIPDVAVAGIARSKEMLLARVKHLVPDLLILDLDGEAMGGEKTLENIRTLHPRVPILIASNSRRLTPRILYPRPGVFAMEVTALDRGVEDWIEKPDPARALSIREFRLRLITLSGMIKSRQTLERHRKPGYINSSFSKASTKGSGPADSFPKPRTWVTRIYVVVIAASTGGPEALAMVLPALPRNLGVPVFVVQHMPLHMTDSLASSLNVKSKLEVTAALDGETIVASRVYVAQGGRHMTVTPKNQRGTRFISLNDNPHENSVRPSADVLFRSIADSFGGGILAVILTGMGQDGKEGVVAMKNKGCICLTQTAASCVVYGMPRAVVDAGLADETLSLGNIPARIVDIVERGGML